jgi:hypothetical protein
VAGWRLLPRNPHFRFRRSPAAAPCECDRAFLRGPRSPAGCIPAPPSAGPPPARLLRCGAACSLLLRHALDDSPSPQPSCVHGSTRTSCVHGSTAPRLTKSPGVHGSTRPRLPTHPPAVRGDSCSSARLLLLGSGRRHMLFAGIFPPSDPHIPDGDGKNFSPRAGTGTGSSPRRGATPLTSLKVRV